MMMTFKCLTFIKNSNIIDKKMSHMESFLKYLCVYIKTMKKAGKNGQPIVVQCEYEFYLSVNQFIFVFLKLSPLIFVKIKILNCFRDFPRLKYL